MKTQRQKLRKSEWVILLAPLLIAAAWLFAERPRWMVERMFGWPRVLKMPSGTELDGIALSSDGKLVAAGWYQRRKVNGQKRTVKGSGDVKFWDTQTGKLVQTIPAIYFKEKLTVGGKPTWLWSGMRAYNMTLSPAGTLLNRWALGDKSRLFDVKTRQQIATLPFPTRYGTFSSDGKLLAASSYDKVWIWNLAKNKVERVFAQKGSQFGFKMQFSPDNRHLACIKQVSERKPYNVRAAFYNGPTQIWDITTGKVLRTFSGYGTSAMAYSPDGSQIVIAEQRDSTKQIPGSSYDTGRIQMRDVKSGRVLWTFGGDFSKRHPEFVFRDIIFAPNGKTVVADNYKGEITFLDANSGEVVKTLVPPELEPYLVVAPPSLAFSSDGKLLVSRAKDSILLWDIKPNQ